jgi:hypothetical protein
VIDDHFEAKGITYLDIFFKLSKVLMSGIGLMFSDPSYGLIYKTAILTVIQMLKQ